MSKCKHFPEGQFDGLPDINKRRTIVDALFNLPVLGGHSRSLSEGPDGEMEVDRYREKLGDFVSRLAVERAVNAMFDDDFVVNQTWGTITGWSLERIIVTTASGEELVFERT